MTKIQKSFKEPKKVFKNFIVFLKEKKVDKVRQAWSFDLKDHVKAYFPNKKSIKNFQFFKISCPFFIQYPLKYQIELNLKELLSKQVLVVEETSEDEVNMKSIRNIFMRTFSFLCWVWMYIRQTCLK